MLTCAMTEQMRRRITISLMLTTQPLVACELPTEFCKAQPSILKFYIAHPTGTLCPAATSTSNWMAATLSYLALSKLLSAFQLPDANRSGHIQAKHAPNASNKC